MASLEERGGWAERRFVRRAAVVVLVVWILGAAALTLGPLALENAVTAGVRPLLHALRELGVPEWRSYAAIEFLANVVFFVPIGVCLAIMLGRRRWGWAIPIAVTASAAIEFAQLVVVSGRASSLADIVANGSGAVIGALVARYGFRR